MTPVPALFKYLPSPKVPEFPTLPCSVGKPVGWWLSVGDAWERWCHTRGFRLERVGWRRPVEFTRDTRVVVLGSRSPAFDEFTEKYGVPLFDPAVAGVSFRRVVSPTGSGSPPTWTCWCCGPGSRRHVVPGRGLASPLGYSLGCPIRGCAEPCHGAVGTAGAPAVDRQGR